MVHLFVDNLTILDFSYFDQKRGILGESWQVNLTLGGELDAQGMIFDFGHVKKQVKQLIDAQVDHRLLLATRKLRPTTENLEDGRTRLQWKNKLGNYEHIAPSEAVVLIDVDHINEENVATYLEALLREVLPANVKEIRVELSQELIEGAWYHYSHGLKKHLGNCQRIVHGHRSRLEIYKNHKRDAELEDLWAARFRDIYIGTREDVQRRFEIDGKAHIEFAYTGSQGKFELVMPSSQVYLIDSDSTVELIAEHIAQKCQKSDPDNHFLVKAYEGIGKGAIAVRQP